MTELKKSLLGVLKAVPTSVFGMALGIAGLGAAFRVADKTVDLDLDLDLGFGFGFGIDHVGITLIVIATVVLTTEVILHVLKILLSRQNTEHSIPDAVTINLVAPAFMAAMIISAQPEFIAVSGTTPWYLAVMGQLVLLTTLLGKWLTKGENITALNPTWFLPTAGTMTAAVTAPSTVDHLFVLFAFSIGVSLWLVLLPIIIFRLTFHAEVAHELRPTLFIIAAPFGLAAISLINLFPDYALNLSAVLSYAGLFVIIVLVSRLNHFRLAGSRLSWWSTTFPVSTIAIALFRLSENTGNDIHTALALLLVVLATGFVSIAIVATLRFAWTTRLGATDAVKSP